MDQESFNIVLDESVAYSPESEMGMIQLVRKGISKKALLNLSELAGISLKKLSELLPVSERTLQRYSDNDRLGSAVSEHVILMVKVLLRASEIFGDTEAARIWLNSSIPALSNNTPLSLLDTSFGAQLVMDELGRLEAGVYS